MLVVSNFALNKLVVGSRSWLFSIASQASFGHLDATHLLNFSALDYKSFLEKFALKTVALTYQSSDNLVKV